MTTQSDLRAIRADLDLWSVSLTAFLEPTGVPLRSWFRWERGEGDMKLSTWRKIEARWNQLRQEQG